MPVSEFWIKAASSFGGLGYCPVAPGTAGSLGGVAAYLLILWLGGGWFAALLAAAALVLFAIWVSNRAEKLYGRKDPGKIVIDEAAGMLVTLLGVPFHWVYLLAGFVLFRLFDILKIYPANRFEEIPGGTGIVLDDVMSGIYAWGALQGIILLTRSSLIP